MADFVTREWNLNPYPGSRVRVWREGTGRERSAAVELLRVTGDPGALELVPQFLADPDWEVQVWGGGVVDQLLMDDVVEPPQAEECLRLMESHQLEVIRDQAALIREYLAAGSRSRNGRTGA